MWERTLQLWRLMAMFRLFTEICSLIFRLWFLTCHYYVRVYPVLSSAFLRYVRQVCVQSVCTLLAKRNYGEVSSTLTHGITHMFFRKWNVCHAASESNQHITACELNWWRLQRSSRYLQVKYHVTYLEFPVWDRKVGDKRHYWHTHTHTHIHSVGCPLKARIV
jgi:hypothetical protein